MPQLSIAEYQDLGSSVTRTLKDAILRGVLEPGSHLVESAIAEQMGVSRGPVRDAIQELEKQGLVANVPRRGAYVAQWSADDIEEIYTLRMALEGLAARLAAVNMTSEECGALHRLVQDMGKAGSIEESVELDLRFHESLCAAAHNSRLQKALGEMHTLIELCIAWSQPVREAWLGPKGLVHEHAEILAAVCSRDPTLAEKVMRASLEDAARRVMAKLRKSEPAGLTPEVVQN